MTKIRLSIIDTATEQTLWEDNVYVSSDGEIKAPMEAFFAATNRLQVLREGSSGELTVRLVIGEAQS